MHVVLTILTPAQVKAYRLMDNRSHDETEFDLELLGPEFEELRALDFDLNLTGFNELEFDALLRDPMEEEKADQAPPLPEVAATRPGDLWLLGPHRLLCGDATNPKDVASAFGPTRPFLMVCDPPYGVSYDPMWREVAGLGHQRQTGKVANDDQADWTPAYKLFPGA